MSGSNPVSGSGTASISQEQSGLPVAWAEMRSSWQRLAEPAYLSHRGEHKKPKMREDPVSLNNVAATQDKGTSFPLKLPQTPSDAKGLGK